MFLVWVYLSYRSNYFFNLNKSLNITYNDNEKKQTCRKIDSLPSAISYATPLEIVCIFSHPLK